MRPSFSVTSTTMRLPHSLETFSTLASGCARRPARGMFAAALRIFAEYRSSIMRRLCGGRRLGFPGGLGPVAHGFAERPEPGLERLLRLLADQPHRRAFEELAVGEDAVAVVERLDLDEAGGADQTAHHREIPDN